VLTVASDALQIIFEVTCEGSGQSGQAFEGMVCFEKHTYHLSGHDVWTIS